MFEHPGNDTGDGGLAVSAGHCDDMTVLQDLVVQPRRTRAIAQLVAERVFDTRITTRQGIADEHDVGRGF